jgi:hypothetical protein
MPSRFRIGVEVDPVTAEAKVVVGRSVRNLPPEIVCDSITKPYVRLMKVFQTEPSKIATEVWLEPPAEIVPEVVEASVTRVMVPMVGAVGSFVKVRPLRRRSPRRKTFPRMVGFLVDVDMNRS